MNEPCRGLLPTSRFGSVCRVRKDLFALLYLHSHGRTDFFTRGGRRPRAPPAGGRGPRRAGGRISTKISLVPGARTDAPRCAIADVSYHAKTHVHDQCMCIEICDPGRTLNRLRITVLKVGLPVPCLQLCTPAPFTRHTLMPQRQDRAAAAYDTPRRSASMRAPNPRAPCHGIYMDPMVLGRDHPL